MRLYHFSDDPNIELFVPRPVRVPAERPKGYEWLNGPLVWAIEESHQAMYLFPRECPRILLWRTAFSTEEDVQTWWQGSEHEVLAYIETAWVERLSKEHIYRYELPQGQFESIDDAGMWIAKKPVKPIDLITMKNLRCEHENHSIELRTLDDLLPLKGVWGTSLHASGIRLRNAQHWGKPGWTHSKKGRVVPVTKPD